MNNSTYPNNSQEAIFVPVPVSCSYHVTFDLDLDLEHILDACWPGVYSVQVWWRSGHLPARSDWSACTNYVHCSVTDLQSNWLQYFAPASGRSNYLSYRNRCVIQESCAIAKMCLWPIHGCPEKMGLAHYTHGYFSLIFMVFCFGRPYKCAYKIWSP